MTEAAKTLSVEKQIEVRFSEIDMMNVVWHGAYPLYMEDAREAFGAEYGLSYHRYIKENIFAPLVELKMDYKKPITYGMKPVVRISYVPTEAAKIIFDYVIFNPDNGDIFMKARTVQVFMDRNYDLMWNCPEFYEQWKEAMGLV